MLGGDGLKERTPGVLPCAVRDVFKATGAERQVWVSYLEIYNEQVNDLLIGRREEGQSLKVIQDGGNGQDGL